MKTPNWQDYQVLEAGNGLKMERWKNVYLLRPDPQAIWPANFEANLNYKNLNAEYIRSGEGGGKWITKKNFPDEWTIEFENLKFLIKPMGFKHTGLFPEQAVNWKMLQEEIKNNIKTREVKVLNLFGYTGGATVACAESGASVCHVDASKGMVERCKQNIQLSKIENAKVRYIVDDCEKFVEREIRRNSKYDIIIMDPPSYGRGPNGEMWKLEDNLYNLVEKCVKVFSDKPICFLINSYTTGLQPSVIENILKLALKDFKGCFESYELGLKIENSNLILPCGCSGVFKAN